MFYVCSAESEESN